MILDIVVMQTDDGYTAEIPSIKGCETWSHNEDEVLDKVLELAQFYLKIEVGNLKVDIARKSRNKTIYKLIFDK